LTKSFFHSCNFILKNILCFSHIYFSVSFGTYVFEILTGPLSTILGFTEILGFKEILDLTEGFAFGLASDLTFAFFF
tara:strand:+ start:659 stop:889 length:231 start_codon:yes stop_codon:yes gene_type:complete